MSYGLADVGSWVGVGAACGVRCLMRNWQSQTLLRDWYADTSRAGHLLVTTRNHKVKVADMEAQESREIGKLATTRVSQTLWFVG